ncbi:Protein spinster-like 1 [Porphyridium purpureum]|uniref:Protein spinster-like 1 n=1 Tax=Porphyridium purpureum TaxID=35688 RepID=A0A5J4Z7W9_PORPP|nr:Protein spinster-like 1 [Porphyridium purpureum]|eukprot:POR4321..scf295_1
MSLAKKEGWRVTDGRGAALARWRSRSCLEIQLAAHAMFSRGLSVFVLFSINLLNYIDRWTVAGVLSDMQLPEKHGGFGIGDAEGGLLTSVFILTYLICSPIFGYLGDRMDRNKLIFVGVTAWSSAVFLGSFASSFRTFLVCRALVGIGEASYANVAPTLIADMYSIDERTRVLSLYFCAVPLGSALGFILGGQTSLYLNWRWAFRITPGFSFALACVLGIWLKEPARGSADGRLNHFSDYEALDVDDADALDHDQDIETRGATEDGTDIVAGPLQSADGAASTPRITSKQFSQQQPSRQSWSEDVREIWGVRSFMWSTLGLTSVTFVMGALAQWGPTFLHRVVCTESGQVGHALSACKSNVNLIFGLISCVTGISGTFLGSYLSRRYSTEQNAADAVLCCVGMLIAAPFIFLGVFVASQSLHAAWAMIFVAELAVGVIWVPVTAMLLYVIHPLQRASASGMQTMFSHLFGDATSPVLVGYIADMLRRELDVPLARALQLALYPSACFAFAGALCFLVAAQFLADDRRAQNSALPIKVHAVSSASASPTVHVRTVTMGASGGASLSTLVLSRTQSPVPPRRVQTAALCPLLPAEDAHPLESSIEAAPSELRRR